MDENDKIAIQSVYLQIKSNIDAAEPPDYLSLTQLEKIKNTSKVFIFFSFFFTYLHLELESIPCKHYGSPRSNISCKY